MAFELAAIFICALATAQNPQPSSRAAYLTSGQYTIAGVLTNAATGDPIRRATVEALKEDDSRTVASCITDNEGRFVLDHLAAMKYQLTASKRGFRTASYDEHDGFSSAIVTGPDQDTTHLEFKLIPGSVLRGVVSSDDGEPVAGARVMLFQRPKSPAAGERTTQVNASITDDTGAYEIGDLAAGEYLLAVAAEPWYAVHEGVPAKRNAALDVAYPITYFDSTTEERSATPLVLAGGSSVEANISLHALPALHLTIAVPRKPDGSLARPELQQTIFGNAIASESAGFIDALQTGSVEMSGIAPGHYELTQGDPPRIADLDLASSQQVDANVGIAANSISGIVRMASSAPVPDEITISLERMDGGNGQALFAAQARRGRFKFDPVPPGEWTVMATSGDKAVPVVAVGVGNAATVGNMVMIRERAPQLTVFLSEAVTRLEGFAKKNDKGFSGAMIVLLPKNPALWKALTRRDQSDSDGSFALQDVAPGEYTAIAIEDGWQLDWTNPQAMARYLPGGANVSVTEKSNRLIRLTSPLAVQMR
ncbi:carboxypeptidase-like regulatory domain-containing protein [Telmatobacter sp. DSM 110680]|uniref:Carboxypeptidase-like regulatory domain-containing protein n=1 Tax=Telmatobacter sp. DSM 110680 TaxID=3036704 RepID=A0AAU7DGV7_9BACT